MVNYIYKSFFDVIMTNILFTRKRLLVAILLLLFTILISGCGSPDIPACVPVYTTTADCPVVNCPFDQCFEGDYVKEMYVSGKVQILGISNTACSTLFEDKYNSTNYVCKLLQAEQIYKVGNTPEGEKWEWSIDCACSYEK